MSAPFRDRHDAGRQLADRLKSYAHRDDVVVLALPRGGVVVGYEVAEELGVPLDVFLVRKLGVPGHEELAMGAVASGGVRVLDSELVDVLGISAEELESIVGREQRELDRRERMYRGSRPVPDVRGRTVIVVDDGLANGAYMQDAVEALRQLEPEKVIVAVPVSPRSVCEAIRHGVDETICVLSPEPFVEIAVWYEDFFPIEDAEVHELLERHALAAGNGNTEA